MFNWFSFTIWILSFFSSLRISFQIRSNSFCCSTTISCISSNMASGVTSKCILDFFPNSIIRLSVATRTRKNSSRLLENIPRKRMRSLNGTVSSAASCKTRLLNESQLISRNMVFLFCKQSFLK